MVKKIIITLSVIMMLFINVSVVYGNGDIYHLTHEGIIQEGSLDTIDYQLDSWLEDYLVNQLNNKETIINVKDYNISLDQIDGVIQELLNNNPMFYNVSFDTCTVFNNQVLELYPIYQVSKLRSTNDAYEFVVQEILSNITEDMTNLEKIVYLHEWLVFNVEYDYDNYLNGTIPSESYTAYGALVNGKAVCQGYSLAFKDLLNRLGFESILVSSNELNHVWNQVYLDGYWYYIDATWDDPVPDKKGQVLHDNLLVSQDKLISTGHDYGDWTTHYETDSNKYDDYFWSDVTHSLELVDGYVYSASNTYNDSTMFGEVSINKVNINTEEITSIYSFTDRWMVLNQSGYFWTNAFSGCVYYDNRIYFNNSTQIRSIAIDGSDNRLEVDVNPTTNYLTGLIKDDEGLYYILQDINSTTGNATEVIKFFDTAIPVTSITVFPEVLSMEIGDRDIIKVSIFPSNHTDTKITYSSSNEDVVTIDDLGNVTAIGNGTSTITISASNGVSGRCIVNVGNQLLLGDVNNDGKVSYSDAVMILKADSKTITLTPLQQSVADVNGDGEINYNDAVKILQMDAGLTNQ